MDITPHNWTQMENSTYPLETTYGGTEKPLNLLFLLVTPIIVLVAAGNILVIIAVCMDNKLRSSTNYFLTSLAVADLLVALTVMPLSLAMIINNYIWPFSDELCGVWVMLDVFFSTSSILHLCMISLDRYLALTRPFHYRQQRGAGGGSKLGGIRYGFENNTNFTRKVATRILVVWTVALAIAVPLPILGKQDRNNLMIDGMCAINMPEFATFGSLVAFFLPLVIMFVMYTLTIRMLRKQARLITNMMIPHSWSSSHSHAGKRHRSFRHRGSGAGDATSQNDTTAQEGVVLMRPARHFTGSVANEDDGSVTDSMKSVLTRGFSRSSGKWDQCEKCGTHIGDQKSSGGQHWAQRTLRPIAKALRQVQSIAGFGGMVPSADMQKNEMRTKLHTKRCSCKPFEHNNNDRRDRKGNFFPRKFPSYGRRLSSSFKNRAMASINNEQRASKVLGLIFVLFCLFWCPFFITNVVSRFCPSCDQALMGECMNWFVWVGYVSSGVNPCVYTMFSKRFRDTFFKLITCKFAEINKRPIRRTYSSRRDNASNTSFVTFGGSTSKRKVSKQHSLAQTPTNCRDDSLTFVETNHKAPNSDSADSDDANGITHRGSVLYKSQCTVAANSSTIKLWRSTWHATFVDEIGSEHGGAKISQVCEKTMKPRDLSFKRHFSASDADQHPRDCQPFMGPTITETDFEGEFTRSNTQPPPWIAQPEDFSKCMTSSTDDESVWTSEAETSNSESWTSVYDNVENTGPINSPNKQFFQQTTNTNHSNNAEAIDLTETLELYDDFCDQSCLIKRREALTRKDSGMGASFEGSVPMS